MSQRKARRIYGAESIMYIRLQPQLPVTLLPISVPLTILFLKIEGASSSETFVAD
jgi:hypothetical protein